MMAGDELKTAAGDELTVEESSPSSEMAGSDA
jgi:hypothetical protein